MVGKRNSTIARAAAIAAAERVKLLLTVVKDDDFLTEVLHNADRTMSGLQDAPDRSERLAETPRGRARLTRIASGRGRHGGRG